MQQDIAKYIVERPNIKDDIAALCKGLDRRSRESILRIIGRLRESYFRDDKRIYSLTIDEIHNLKTIQIDFKAQIYHLAKDVYCYNEYFLPQNHFEIGVFFYKHNLELFKTLPKFRDKNIIDVGGFIGDSAIVFEEFTNKNIYSFEATKSNFKLMQKTIELNNSTKIIPVNKGLGSKSEKIKISLNGSGSSMIYEYGSNFEEVEIITLDSYVQEHNLDVGFIKVDIEGFEMEFLKGALETIKTQKPAMLISIYHQASDFFGIKPFIDSINLGYTFHFFKPTDGSVSTEGAIYCEVLDD